MLKAKDEAILKLIKLWSNCCHLRCQHRYYIKKIYTKLQSTSPKFRDFGQQWNTQRNKISLAIIRCLPFLPFVKVSARYWADKCDFDGNYLCGLWPVFASKLISWLRSWARWCIASKLETSTIGFASECYRPFLTPDYILKYHCLRVVILYRYPPYKFCLIFIVKDS